MNLFSRQVRHQEKNWGRGADVRLRALKQASLSVARLGESPAGGLALEKLMVVEADDECFKTAESLLAYGPEERHRLDLRRKDEGQGACFGAQGTGDQDLVPS